MLHLRWGLHRDLPDIMAVESASFEREWTEDDFLRCGSQRNCITMVAEWTDREKARDVIAGFMIYELHRDRLDLLNFAVHPAYRRRGVGSAMLAKLKCKLISHRREKLTTIVREGNIGALRFFHEQGMRATGMLRGCFSDIAEDGYTMEYRPTEAEWEQAGGAPVNRIVALWEQ